MVIWPRLRARDYSGSRAGRQDGLWARLSAVPWWVWPLAIVFVEATLLIILVPTSWSWATGGDGAEYQRYAHNLLHHGVFSEAPFAPYYPGVVRSPGYPAFLAAIEWVGGAHVLPVEIVQFAVVGAMAVLVGLIGREIVGPATGTVAAVICATYMPFLSDSTSFLTEVLASFGLTLVIYLVLRTRRSDSRWLYAGIGLALALLTYVRPESALLAIPFVVIFVFRRRGGWASADRWTPALVFAGVFVVLLVPWMVRDASVTGGQILPMAANGGSDLVASADQYDGLIDNQISGNQFEVYDRQIAKIVHSPRTAVHGIQASVEYVDARQQVKVDREERSAAIKLFKGLSVGTLIKSQPKRNLYLWGVAYPAPPGRFTNQAHDLAVLQWILLSVLGLAGLVIRRRHLLAEWPLWIAAVYLTLAHVVFHIETRYTLPARPPLMVYSAVSVIAVVSVLRRATSRTPGNMAGAGQLSES